MIIQGALCDNDGTLVESEHLLHAACEELVAKHGGDFRTFDYRSIIGKPDIACCRIVLEHFGFDHDPEDFHEQYKAIVYGMIERQGVPLRPGVHAFLDQFDAARIPAVIVTSGTQEHMERVLGSSGLLQRFAFAVTADTPGLTARKPSSAPYRLAAELLRADPSRCIAFEDSPSGVRSAFDAGCFVYGTPHAFSPAKDLCEAHMILGSLADFRVEDAAAHLSAHVGSFW